MQHRAIAPVQASLIHVIVRVRSHPSNHRIGMVKMDKIVSKKRCWVEARILNLREKRSQYPDGLYYEDSNFNPLSIIL